MDYPCSVATIQVDDEGTVSLVSGFTRLAMIPRQAEELHKALGEAIEHARAVKSA